jgi:predicted phosphodiesterase
MTKKIGVISDIHSNAIALELALSELLNQNINQCIILGDLLTYGTQPNEVIELLLAFQDKVACIFIKGNHEEFYFDIENNINPIKYKMPKFVEESIFWTNDKLKYNLQNTFKWIESFTIKNIYFSHANPFEYGNWTYMNKEEDILSASKSLYEKGFSVGIFGHTHRNKNYMVSDKYKKCELYLANNFNPSNNQLILNTGSLGQPRGTQSNIMIFNISDNLVQFKNIEVNIDSKLMIDEIAKTTLSFETKNKINSFWEINND